MSKITSAMAALGVVAGLGVAALPMASYAAESGPVTIKTTVNGAIAIEVLDKVTSQTVSTVDLGTVNSTSGKGVGAVTVKVSGAVAKYNLGVTDFDTDTAMQWTNDGGIADQSGTVTEIKTAEVNDTDTDGTDDGFAELPDGRWGFRVANEHATPGNWFGVPAYANGAKVDNIVKEGDMTNNEASIDVEFGVSVKGLSDLKNGVYEDKVVFTATAGN